MIAVGSDDPNPSGGGKVHIYEYNDSTRWVPYPSLGGLSTLNSSVGCKVSISVNIAQFVCISNLG